jgi:hypothetical protein
MEAFTVYPWMGFKFVKVETMRRLFALVVLVPVGVAGYALVQQHRPGLANSTSLAASPAWGNAPSSICV